MDFRIAATFTYALTRLTVQDQKSVKVSVLDLQLDPSAPGLQMHRIDKPKDPNFWSARVGRDLPLILHKTAARILVAYVDHHDAAYAWAERRRIEAHPRTGAIQIVEVRERVAAAQPDLARLWTDAPAPTVSEASPAAPAPLLFENLDRKRCWRWASRSTGSNRSSTPPNSASSTLATTCRKAYERAVRLASIEDAHRHDLRRSGASWASQGGMSFEAVAALLGDSVDITRRHYAVFSPDYLQGVVDSIAKGSGGARARDLRA
jgi:hypothetical protein